ncbi:T9SS type A sorting domain-containing protein [Crocinitomix catalasitica]|uniref:T9SS type A sorting domain-containing protein n=1 Tax=Crocinitomix catalasitica TaxID=184607 RepID=UPI000A02AF55|nr:T9SS type A sorting domain-containing protein [Crocinitomix catalasitica]
MLKPRHYILLLFSFMLMTVVFAQPTINERYEIDRASNSMFGSVVSTDSCYFVGGGHGSLPGFYDRKGNFIKYNFDGSINTLTIVDADTLGMDLWLGNNLIKTLDGNLACYIYGYNADNKVGFTFVKISPTGEILTMNYNNSFYIEDSNDGKNPSTLIQSADSTYFGIVHVFNLGSSLGGITFFRLDKHGNLMYKKTFYGDSIATYNTLRSASMVQLNDTELMIGCAYRKDAHETSEVRHHTRLMKIDTLGELLEEHTYYEDDLSYDCNSLTRTADGGFLYGGRIGLYYPEYDGILYKSRVVKLNEDYSVAWEIPYGDYYTSGFAKNFTKILPLNEREFVVTGYVHTETGIMGCLVKFNIDGELLWHRKYMKVPLAESGNEHYLYDVEQTPDGGFVMVGQAFDRLEITDLPGQKAWLVKTDEYGCLVPGCEDDDLGIDNPVKTVQSKIYPNPAKNTLFYYHHQDNFEPVTITIHSIHGQQVHEWQLHSNDITCEVDISHFETGVYVLNVVSESGEMLGSEKFVKE